MIVLSVHGHYFNFKYAHVLFIKISAAIHNTYVFPFMYCGEILELGKYSICGF